MAFLGYPRGHRIHEDTPVLKALGGPTSGRDTLPRTERIENQLASTGRALPGHRPLVHALKLLAAVSIFPGRTVLLTSKSIRRSQPSCAPTSGVPSSVSCPWPTRSDRNLPTDRRRAGLVSPRS